MSRIKQLFPVLRLLSQSSASKVLDVTASAETLSLRQFSTYITALEASRIANGALLAPSAVLKANLAKTLTSFSTRGLATTSNRNKNSKQNDNNRERDGIVAAEEEFSAITDKIPQRPISVVEGTSYTIVIIAAIGFAAAVLYAALNELIFSPKEYQCYTRALERIKDDPRVTIRLGTSISAYGSESKNRAARQRIPHRIYQDDKGREHIQLQFHLRGPSGRATVNADMYQEGGSNGEWKYHFLYLDVESPMPQQVVIVRPGQVDF